MAAAELAVAINEAVEQGQAAALLLALRDAVGRDLGRVEREHGRESAELRAAKQRAYALSRLYLDFA